MSHLLIIGMDTSGLAVATGFARAMAMPFDVLALSGETVEVGQARSLAANLGSVPPADGLAEALVEIAKGYTHIAAVSSMASKDLLARLAGLLDWPMVTDVIGVESPNTFKRPIVAGSMVETVEVDGAGMLLTFRPSGFEKIQPFGSTTAEGLPLAIHPKSTVISSSGKAGGRPDLSQAKIVVSGGRPLKDAETFERVIGGFADSLGAAVGATRAAVDSGIAPNELQVGQTGKIVAPDLYIAAGISGSTQHMAGIKDSKVIVAINTDADAPIFEVADYGLVQDLFTALPELQQKLKT